MWFQVRFLSLATLCLLLAFVALILVIGLIRGDWTRNLSDLVYTLPTWLIALTANVLISASRSTKDAGPRSYSVDLDNELHVRAGEQSWSIQWKDVKRVVVLKRFFLIQSKAKDVSVPLDKVAEESLEQFLATVRRRGQPVSKGRFASFFSL